MKVILVNEHLGHTRTIVLKGWVKGLLSVCLLGFPVVMGYGTYLLALSNNPDILTRETARNWEQQIKAQADQLASIKEKSEQQLNALTMRLAKLQARLVRLDAVGERITSIAKLDNGEFDFSQPVPLGGPDLNQLESHSRTEILSAVEQLERQLEDRQQQLDILEGLMVDRQIDSDVLIAGSPVRNGWIASGYGRRIDPFTGQIAFHPGVDFTTGKAGTEILTVGSGVVTWSGPRSEYGLMVEVNHGNGLSTRYAHAEKLLVEVGDIVKRAQAIALIGSTGRSTGPHVHFEVFKNGRVVDPATYIHRTAR